MRVRRAPRCRSKWMQQLAPAQRAGVQHPPAQSPPTPPHARSPSAGGSGAPRARHARAGGAPHRLAAAAGGAVPARPSHHPPRHQGARSTRMRGRGRLHAAPHTPAHRARLPRPALHDAVTLRDGLLCISLVRHRVGRCRAGCGARRRVPASQPACLLQHPPGPPAAPPRAGPPAPPLQRTCGSARGG